jgi:cytoskeletal protein RodZ
MEGRQLRQRNGQEAVKRRDEETSEDRTIGKAVAASLRDASRSVTGKCLDAETLAAFFDRTLTHSERAACEDHILTCLRCQEYLAELARLVDADEPVVLPDEEIAAAERKSAGGGHLRLAWAVPLLALLIFLGFWFRQDLDQFWRGPEGTARNEGRPEIPSENASKSAKERKAETLQLAAGEETSKGKTESAAPLPEPSPNPPREEARAGAPAMIITGGAAKTDEAAGAGAILTPRERAALSQASKPADRVLNYSASELGRADRTAAAAAPAAPTSAEAPSAEAGANLAKAGASPLSGVTVRGNAPRFSPRWRVSRQGIIQRADETGGWVNVPSGVREDLFDIIFAGDTAGWIVGHEGTVLRSTDGGATWQKVPSPTLDDLVRVSAESDRQAQVISRSGRIFSTTDGGKTWRPASP